MTENVAGDLIWFASLEEYTIILTLQFMVLRLKCWMIVLTDTRLGERDRRTQNYSCSWNQGKGASSYHKLYILDKSD